MDSKSDKVLMKIACAQINLLAKMCDGNNERVIEFLKDIPGTESIGMKVDFSFVMTAIEDDEMVKKQPLLRARLVELLKGGFSQYHT